MADRNPLGLATAQLQAKLEQLRASVHTTPGFSSESLLLCDDLATGLANIRALVGTEAVAWQFRMWNIDTSGWGEWLDCPRHVAETRRGRDGYEVRALGVIECTSPTPATVQAVMTAPCVGCHCRACNPGEVRMFVCNECGCKRCPRAATHTAACTGRMVRAATPSGKAHTCSGCEETRAQSAALLLAPGNQQGAS